MVSFLPLHKSHYIIKKHAPHIPEGRAQFSFHAGGGYSSGMLSAIAETLAGFSVLCNRACIL